VVVLSTPADFHRELLDGAERAREQVALASLYVGHGPKEAELVAALDRGARRGPRTTHIVLDRWRASRGGGGTAAGHARDSGATPAGEEFAAGRLPGDPLALLRTAPGVRVSLLSSPRAASSFAPPASWALLQEVLGVQVIYIKQREVVCTLGYMRIYIWIQMVIMYIYISG